MPTLTVVNTRDEASAEGVEELISATELRDVRVDEVHAGPVTIGSGDEMRVQLERGLPQFASPEGSSHLLVRLEHQLRCQDPGANETTDVQVFHLLAFEVTNDITAEAADLAAWVQANVYFIAYPYVRQFLTAITAALGLPPVVLGYMKREDWPDFAPPTSADTQATE